MRIDKSPSNSRGQDNAKFTQGCRARGDLSGRIPGSEPDEIKKIGRSKDGGNQGRTPLIKGGGEK